MTKVVDSHERKASFIPCPLSAVIVHPFHASAVVREHPDGMLPPLRLDDGPRDVIENHDVRSLRLERVGRNDEHASPKLGHLQFSFPLQATYVAVAKPSVNGEESHACKVRRQPAEECVLLLPRDRVGCPWVLRQHRDQWRQTLEPRPPVLIAIRAGGSVQYRAHDFQTAVDRCSACTAGKTRLHERFQRLIVDLLRFEISYVQLN